MPSRRLLYCLQVRPWVVDIAQDLRSQSLDNEVTYHGRYQGHDPEPEGQPGFIMMQSNIVLYI